jgi:opine dehydrogenase
MRVAVLGGSHGAYATAADLSLAGHQVRLWRRQEGDLAPVRAAGGISLVAEGRNGLARPERLTADLAEALADAEVVIIPLPATAHQDLARRLAKELSPRQIVLLTPGTFGSYVMAREIARAGGSQPFAFAETGTLPYLTRKTGPAEVTAPVRAANLPTGVFPAAHATEALARLRELFPSVRACRDALDVALTNAGTVIHPPLVLLNAGAIDAGRFDIHVAGTTPSVRRLIDAADAERVETRLRLGYPAPHYEQATYYDEARAAEGLYGVGAKAKLVASGLWSELLTFDHRYVTEDAALGLPLYESAGRLANVETPAVSGLLSVFGVLLGRDLRAEGRGLDRLGLGEFTLREIRSLLREGWLSPMWRRVRDGGPRDGSPTPP